MTYPKMKPCPNCGTDEHLCAYAYENGWKHVECDKCFYLGPGHGRTRDAIRAHNDRCAFVERDALANRPVEEA